MAVLVKEVTTTKSGKGLRVLLDNGTWYNAFLNSGLNGAKGKMIEVEVQVHEKFGPSIIAWKEVAGAAPPPPAAAPAVQETRHREPEYAQPNQAPFWLPMCSNIVAHAIAAGRIQNPSEVSVWVNAVRGCFASKLPDSDLPF